LGYGEFRNQHPSASSRYVLSVAAGANCIFEANWVQSSYTPIYVNCTSGSTQILIRDSLISEAFSGNAPRAGDSAARLLSGTCNLTVGKEIYSAATMNGKGLYLGSASPTASGTFTVRCPKIYGSTNAIAFGNSTKAQVYTDVCTASGGYAVAVTEDGSTNSILQATAELRSTSGDTPAVFMAAGKLTLLQSRLLALNGQTAIRLDGTPANTNRPYLVLNNCEIWTQSAGVNRQAITADVAATYKMRIVGVVQSDCPVPTDVIKIGGTWDEVAHADTYYAA
jgi:hypothetical protein